LNEGYLESLFPPGTEVLALPTWRSARLYIPVEPTVARRWRASAMYPGNRAAARAVRLLARAKGALGLGRARARRTAVRADWPLGAFLREALPDAANVSLLLKIADAVPRVTIEVRNAAGLVVGYVKYAAAREMAWRLEHERAVLSSGLARGAPRVLAFGALGEGHALLLSPLCGRRFWPVLPPPAGLLAFADSHTVSPPVALAQHPWVRTIGDKTGGRSDALFAQIDSVPWPVAVHHGDLMPSNLRIGADGAFAAFDWEWGTCRGFPHLDLLQYVLLILLLLRRWSLPAAADYAARWLASRRELGIGLDVARVLTRLAALDRWVNGRDDGAPDDRPDQRLWHGIAMGGW
jgi:hypothetical protein